MLQTNNTLVTLDISGCYIDKTSSDAVYVMLSLNKSLQYLFLNPSHMEKPDAVSILNSYNANTTLNVLSLYKCFSGGTIDTVSKFEYSTDQDIHDILNQVKKSRESRNKSNLLIIW